MYVHSLWGAQVAYTAWDEESQIYRVPLRKDEKAACGSYIVIFFFLNLHDRLTILDWKFNALYTIFECP